MAKREACDIVHTRDVRPFQFRVSHSATKDLPRGLCAHTTTVVAGCVCDAICFPRGPLGYRDDGWIRLALVVRTRSNPTLKGAKVMADMLLLDKTGSPASTVKARTLQATENYGGGYILLARREDVEANCVVDDYFVALCSVAIVRSWPPPAPSMEEHPDLGHDLAKMSDKQDLTDVCFNVDGETFSAHRLVLAARSPVFKAELYGPMVESKMGSITIQDMRASTFRSMLHYMYHGLLPATAADMDEASTNAEFQHLLVAADRYRLDVLKQMCEEMLCAVITTDTVTSTMELAEEQACPKLKARCLDFLSDGENFKMVATTDEYLQLIQRLPSLLVEVRNRFKRARSS